MKKMLLLASVLLVFGIGFIGCSRTAEGVKEDANSAEHRVTQAADKAVDVTKDATKNAAEAVSVTPKIKLAIISDTKLSDSRNKISVGTAEGVIHLTGHVVDVDMKSHAEEVAKKTMKDAGMTEKLSNELTVEAH